MKNHNNTKTNDVICIIGMHRSGTSMITRLLNLCGMEIGPSDQLIEPLDDNPIGFFENKNFLKINEDLLAHFGGSLYDLPSLNEGWEFDPSLIRIVNKSKALLKSFSECSKWGWKDPRTSVLLPFWKSLIPSLRFVICIRNPLDIAKSLARRDRIPIEKGFALWNQYMQEAIRHTEGCPRIFTFYDDFFLDAYSEINKLVEFCGLQKPNDTSFLQNTITPELRHHSSETIDFLSNDEATIKHKLFYIGLRVLITKGFVDTTFEVEWEEFISKNVNQFITLLEYYSDLAIDKDKAESNVDNLIELWGNLENIVVGKEKHTNKLVGLVEHLKEEIANKEKHTNELVGQVEHLKKKIANKEKHTNKLVGQVEHLKEEIANKEKQITDNVKHTLILEHKIAEGETHFKQIEDHNKHLDKKVEEKNEKINHLEANTRNLEKDIIEKQFELDQLNTTMHNQVKALQTIYSSFGWKILRRIWNLTDIILPLGTRRRGLVRLMHNLPSLLVHGNFARLSNNVRLFGIGATFKEVFNKLLSEKYVFQGTIEIIPAVNNIDLLPDETVTNEDVTISVVVPVKNAGKDFRHFLSMIKNQKGFKDIEIIVVDSGSTDRSIEISKELGTEIINILPQEYSHSYARNLGAAQASGEYILFMVQDALPPSDLWLQELYNALKLNDVVAVSCTEFPREDADLFYRAIVWNHYHNLLEVGEQDRIMSKPYKENHLTLRKNGQLSDIACLISKDIFMKYKFRRDYAEDLDLGIRLIKDGYKLALLSSTRVIHSHNRPAYYHLKRGYVDALVMAQIFPDLSVLAGKPERLLKDIVIMQEILNSIVYNELQKVTVPCTVEELSNIVLEKFCPTDRNGYFTGIDIKRNEYTDNKFSSFVENVYNLSNNGKDNIPEDGILLNSMQNFMKAIFEYIDNTYSVIDEHVLEEFKPCIQKAYAFQCGINLASCYLQRSKSAKKKLDELNKELTKEI